MHVFLIGPGGVGKSTSGAILAAMLGFRFVDVDAAFCARIANIGQYIDSQGYVAYCHANSNLIQDLLMESIESTVFAMPSGCLVHDPCPEVAKRNEGFIRDNGISILLLPSRFVDESVDLVVDRQLQRGFGLKEHREREKYRDRHPRYLSFGDIQIFSMQSPTVIAEQMRRALLPFLEIPEQE